MKKRRKTREIHDQYGAYDFIFHGMVDTAVTHPPSCALTTAKVATDATRVFLVEKNMFTRLFLFSVPSQLFAYLMNGISTQPRKLTTSIFTRKEERGAVQPKTTLTGIPLNIDPRETRWGKDSHEQIDSRCLIVVISQGRRRRLMSIRRTAMHSHSS
jgi:hypothetical protein